MIEFKVVRPPCFEGLRQRTLAKVLRERALEVPAGVEGDPPRPGAARVRAEPEFGKVVAIHREAIDVTDRRDQIAANPVAKAVRMQDRSGIPGELA